MNILIQNNKLEGETTEGKSPDFKKTITSRATKNQFMLLSNKSLDDDLHVQHQFVEPEDHVLSEIELRFQHLNKRLKLLKHRSLLQPMQIIYNLREHVSYRAVLTLRDDIELNEINE
jgi:hypothetical protein